MTISDLVRELFKKKKPEPVGLTPEQLEKAGYQLYPQNHDFYVRYDANGVVEKVMYGIVDTRAKQPRYKKLE